MNWQPIETAPNEGAFLVTDGAYIAEVFWKRAKSDGFPTTTDGYIFKDATHWMPCPDFPTPAETGAKFCHNCGTVDNQHFKGCSLK